jgi:hypothetical protein
MYLLRSLLLLFLPCLVASAAVERKIEKTFSIAPGAIVKIDISGGSIESSVGEPGAVKLTLNQSFRYAGSSEEADRVLRDYDVTFHKEGENVFLRVRSKHRISWGNNSALKTSVRLVVPSDVRLDLDTSGGSITSRGEMKASVRCDTSGGNITVDGGSGALDLDTAGGNIWVGRALKSLKADTSGGRIEVGYVGPDASDVNLDTSGGSISVAVDTTGRFNLVADTSGGRVNVENLSFEATKKSHSHASGPINGGGALLRADTSGGNITVKAGTSPTS